MAANALVCWLEDPEPWLIEEQLIERYDIPLNLDQNKHNRFHPEFSSARKQAKQRAAKLPVLPR
jgi:hypothetical protein